MSISTHQPWQILPTHGRLTENTLRKHTLVLKQPSLHWTLIHL